MGRYRAMLAILILCGLAAAQSDVKLTAGGLATYPSILSEGEKFNASFTVSNSGSGNFQGDITTTLILEKGATGNEILLGSSVFQQTIASGESVRMSFDGGYSLPAGRHKLEARVEFAGGASSCWLDIEVNPVGKPNLLPVTAMPGGTPAMAMPVGANALRAEGLAAREPQSTGFMEYLPYIAVLIILVVAALVAMYVINSRRKRRAAVGEKLTRLESELRALIDERDAIEESLAMAKVSYYKRKIDEASYKDIIKDSQQRLLMVNARIKNLRKR